MLHVCISSLPIFTKPVWTWRPIFVENQRTLDIFDLVYSFYQLAFSSWKQKNFFNVLIFFRWNFPNDQKQLYSINSLFTDSWIIQMNWESSMIVFIHWINFRIQGKIFKCMISNLKKRMSFWRSKKLKSNLQEPSLFGSSFIFWQFKVNCLTVDYWLLILIFFYKIISFD